MATRSNTQTGSFMLLQLNTGTRKVIDCQRLGQLLASTAGDFYMVKPQFHIAPRYVTIRLLLAFPFSFCKHLLHSDGTTRSVVHFTANLKF